MEFPGFISPHHFIFSELSLVAGNKAEFTEDEVMRADKARELRISIGYPGYKKYFKLLRNEFFKNCPISEDDAKRALHIYGADKVMLQGKTTLKKSSKIIDINLVTLPSEIRDHRSQVSVSGDVLFINRIPILHTIAMIRDEKSCPGCHFNHPEEPQR